jgi:hypothetical protein
MNRAASMATTALIAIIMAGCSGGLPSPQAPGLATACRVGWIYNPGTVTPGPAYPTKQPGLLGPGVFQPNTPRGLAYTYRYWISGTSGFGWSRPGRHPRGETRGRRPIAGASIVAADAMVGEDP